MGKTRHAGTLVILVLLAACGDGDNGTPAGDSASAVAAQECAVYCDAEQRAGCAAPQSPAACNQLCLDELGREPACASEFGSMVQCAASQPLACNSAGSPRVDADCSSAEAIYGGCMISNGWIWVGSYCSPYACAGYCDPVFGCVECVDNAHCAPTEECTYDHECRARCVDDSDCPGGACDQLGLCAAAMGGPCPAGGSDCATSRCTDVDANLVTVDRYCTISCVPGGSIELCPTGYVCQAYECRRQ